MLFLGNCPATATKDDITGLCIEVFSQDQDRMTWLNAKQACENKKGRLAVFDTDDKLNFAKEFFATGMILSLYLFLSSISVCLSV